MAHNVQPNHEYDISFPDTGSLLFTVTDGATQGVSGQRTAVIMFRKPGTRSGAPAGLVLHPWEGNRVDIVGEDLYALRELLNELPEEAFVRPADPVEESYCLVDKGGYMWVFIGGAWRIESDSGFGSAYGSFDYWETIAKNYGIDAGEPEPEPEPEPEWIDGDIIYFKGYRLEGYRVRRDGEWVSFGVREDGLPRDPFVETISDRKVNECLARLSSWSVVIKGGVRQP